MRPHALMNLYQIVNNYVINLGLMAPVLNIWTWLFANDNARNDTDYWILKWWNSLSVKMFPGGAISGRIVSHKSPWNQILKISENLENLGIFRAYA